MEHYPPDVLATQPPECGTCGTNSWVLCRRRCVDGRTTYHWQCPFCGRTSSAVKRVVAEAAGETPDVDEELSGRYWAERNAESAARWHENDRLREIESAEWQAGYTGFLQSSRWQQQRERVLDRDRGLCQCCLLYPATQVHHTEYPDGQWDVPLYTLKAVCDNCHKRFSGTRWEG